MKNKVGTGILFLLIDVFWWVGAVTSFYQGLFVEHSSDLIILNGLLGAMFLVAASCLTFVIAYFVGEGFKDER